MFLPAAHVDVYLEEGIFDEVKVICCGCEAKVSARPTENVVCGIIIIWISQYRRQSAVEPVQSMLRKKTSTIYICSFMRSLQASVCQKRVQYTPVADSQSFMKHNKQIEPGG